LSNVTVTCRCARTMRQERGRPAGYLACGCGIRVRLNDMQHGLCHVRGTNGELCDRPVAMTHPIALCAPHILVVAQSKKFVRAAVTDQQRITWQEEDDAKAAALARREAREQRAWEYQEQLRKAELKKQAVVYYIAQGQRIKIGYTTNMAQRMSALQPDAILATEPGTRRLETSRHSQFRHLRSAAGREYFTAGPDLLAHVEKVLAEQGPPSITGYPSYESWNLGARMLMPVKDAARIAGIPVSTLYEWIREARMTVTLPANRQRGSLVNVHEVVELAELRGAGKLPRVDSA
jgi:hypothetical protein